MHFSSWLSTTFAFSLISNILPYSLKFSRSTTLINFTFFELIFCRVRFIGFFWGFPPFLRRIVKFDETEASVLRSHQPVVLSNSNRHSKSKHNAILRSKHFYFSTCKPSVIPRGSLLFNCADHFATHSAPPFIPRIHVAHA